MKQEDKDLLTRDLCARLPYGVKVRIELPLLEEEDYPIEVLSRISVDISTINGSTYGLEETKPLLRPMSSMTKEEYNKYCELEFEGRIEHLSLPLLDWLNANHFDFRNLIEKGLALEAPEGMY